MEVRTANHFGFWEYLVIGAVLLALVGLAVAGVIALVTASRRRDG